VPLRKQRAIVSRMTLCRSDIANATVAVLIIIPMHEAAGPLPCDCNRRSKNPSLKRPGRPVAPE
jgi:hypothetical protein